MLDAIVHTLHVILAGAWLGGVVFTTAASQEAIDPGARRILHGLFPLRISTRLHAPDVHRPAIRPGEKGHHAAPPVSL
jgi:hypothetical protein